MTDLILWCEDCNTSVEVVATFLGPDEDGREQYEIIQGAEPADDRHIDAKHDLSLPSGVVDNF